MSLNRNNFKGYINREQGNRILLGITKLKSTTTLSFSFPANLRDFHRVFKNRKRDLSRAIIGCMLLTLRESKQLEW